MSKALRFAVMPRVSTDKQEQQGESLRTQRKQLEEAVERLGGAIAAWYGGQEHATAGWEREQRDRMLADAEKPNRSFDAVMVPHEDRWSRDDTRSGADLDRLKEARVRFFVLTSEKDLYDPTVRMYLGMSAVIGAYHARNQAKKSLENKIERARRGLPACGRLPFGRTFDAVTGWEIDPLKQRLVLDAAQRYLAGEPMPHIAATSGLGLKHVGLHRMLTTRCGDTWVQEFNSRALNIHAKVTTQVPPLLPQDMIKQIKDRVQANKTYEHGQAKNHYVLGRMVFCAHCGYAMFGQTKESGRRYYVHPNPRHVKRQRHCSECKEWVSADALENAVLWELFELFGNPAAVQRAVEAATPNRDKMDHYVRRLGCVEKDLGEVGQARDRILRFIAKGTITEEQAEKQLNELSERDSLLTKEVNAIKQEIASAPTAEEVKQAAVKVSGAFHKYADALLRARKQDAISNYDGMSWEDKRHLTQMVFAGKTADGRRLGVYLERCEGGPRGRRRWRYRLLGRLVDATRLTPPADFQPDGEDIIGGHAQAELLRQVNQGESTCTPCWRRTA